jgi:hypothetical protein
LNTEAGCCVVLYHMCYSYLSFFLFSKIFFAENFLTIIKHYGVKVAKRMTSKNLD